MRFHVRSSMALALAATVTLTSLNLAPAQAALLFPSRAALQDTLPAASPYRRPEPAGEGSF